MMNTRKLWTILAVLGLAGTLALAQPGPGGPEGPGPHGPRGPRDPNRPIPPAGFWPTPRMMEQIIGRVAEGMRNHYNMDDNQVAQTRELFKAKFPEWLEANRGELQDLMNGYIESIMSETPPTPEEVAQWAARIEPLMEQFSQLAKETAGEMETYLNDDQRAILNGEIAVMDLAFNNFRGRIQNWKNGGFDYETEWPGGERFGATQQQQAQEFEQQANEVRVMHGSIHGRLEQPLEGGPGGASAASGGGAPGASPGEATATLNPAAPGAAPKAPAAPKDEWADYTESFIKRYKLSEDQQGQARRILKARQEERDKYLRRKASEINALDKRLDKADKAKDEAERAKIRTDWDKLNEPLDRMFQRLKDQLGALPTRKQRAEAGKEEAGTRVKAEPKPAAKTDKAP